MTSGRQITPLRREDIPELSQFLIQGFGVPATDPCFAHDVLLWKYFDGPDGPVPESDCSLVSRSAGKIIGHIGICRRQFIVTGDATPAVSTMHAIDWLGSQTHPGSGALLMMQAMATCKSQYAVGGSAQAQSVFPRLGFESKPSLHVFRKVLTPFYRLRTTSQSTFRKWAGTAKDAVSVLRARRPTVQHQIQLHAVPTFTTEIDCLMRKSSARIVTCQRDHLLLNYFLRYPLSGFSGWTFHDTEQTIGFALLNVTGHGRIQRGKIVDCWLATEDPSYWQTAVDLLVDRLRTLSADTVTCYAATASLHAALVANGFARSGETNIYLRDKDHLLPADLPLGISMLEADHAII